MQEFDFIQFSMPKSLSLLVQTFKYSDVQMFKCSNIQMFRCSNVQMFKRSNPMASEKAGLL